MAPAAVGGETTTALMARIAWGTPTGLRTCFNGREADVGIGSTECIATSGANLPAVVQRRNECCAWSARLNMMRDEDNSSTRHDVARQALLEDVVRRVCINCEGGQSHQVRIETTELTSRQHIIEEQNGGPRAYGASQRNLAGMGVHSLRVEVLDADLVLSDCLGEFSLAV